MKRLVPLLALTAGAALAQEQTFQWQEPQARITTAGSIQWQPREFVDDLSGQEVRYIDYDNGDDKNAGTSPEQAWKHHPWDVAAGGKAAAEAGIRTYVFKRGVIYRGQLYAKHSGSPEQPIRLTSTASWGEGPAILAGSVRLPDAWKRVDQSGIEPPKYLPDHDKVWVLDLGATEWWNDGEAGSNIQDPGGSRKSRKIEAPFIGLFTYEKDHSSSWNHLARFPDWQPAGREFAHDYWPAWDGEVKPFTDTEGKEVKTPGGYDEDLKGKPVDFFVGGIVWSTYPSLMGGATPKNPLQLEVTNKQGQTFHQYDPKQGGFSQINPNGFNPGTRYKIENVPGYLDSPGEFYLDQENDLLYYRPESGVSANDLDLELVVDEQAMIVEDQQHIEVSGLEFRWTDGIAIDLRGDARHITFTNNVFRDLMKHVFYNWIKAPEKDWAKWRNAADWKLELMTGIEISDNVFQNIWDSSIIFSDGRSWQHNRIGRGISGFPWSRIGHVDILRNTFEDAGIRHQGWRYSAIPAVNVQRAETGRIAGNIIKRSFGAAIMVHGGTTSGITEAEIPLTRILIYQNSTEDTALAVNDYGGFSLWEGGLIYSFANTIGNSTGFMPGGLWGNKKPMTLSYPYYIDGGYKIVAFNNIIWDRSIDPNDPYRSETGGYFSVFGFLNHFTNNTLYRHARATGGSSGNRTDIISNVFAEIGEQFIRNNRVENPSLVGGGDTGTSGIQGVPSLAFGRNLFHGPAEAGELVADNQKNGIDVPVDITGPTIEKMAEQMQEFPIRFGELGTKVAQQPIVGELSDNALTEQGDAGADFRLTADSAAIDAGGQYFYPWALARTIGEWHFTENRADPSFVTDFALFMREPHFNRFMYNQIPTFPLRMSNTTLEDYVAAPSEDWTNGAIAFDGKRVGTVGDAAMRADFQLELANYVSNTGQRTYKNFDKSVNKEIWKVPEPKTKKRGQPAFEEGQVAVYPGERRVTLISTTGNLLLEAKFKTDSGHSGGLLMGKHDGSKGYALRIDASGKAVFTIGGKGASGAVTTATAVNDGDWHHVLAEVDRASGSMRIYLDGSLSNEAASGLSADASLDNQADFLVGKDLVGAIDFLRVCHSTLAESKTSIDELYAWQYVNGPFLSDMRGQKPAGERRDAGALERD